MSRMKLKREKWKLSRLKDNPQQVALFGKLPDPDPELQALAADLAKNGQQEPVEVLPDGTLLTGHRRVRAALLLGWKTIEVVVRHDLAEAGPEAAETHFVTDNLLRRHLSPLGRARCLRRLMEIETRTQPGGLRWGEKEALKKLLGQRLNLSLRSVSRYLLVLDTPTEVQAAFDRGEITLIMAGKVALLTKDDRTEISQRIRDGEGAKQVVAEFLCRKSAGRDDIEPAFLRLIRALRREVPQLAGRVNGIEHARLVRCRSVISDAVSLLTAMLKQKAA